MYRRYLVIGIVFFVLIGAYFVFFGKDDDSKKYEEYYEKLVEKDVYASELTGVDLDIYVENKETKYVYTIVISDVSEKMSNVKVLVVDDASSDNNKYFPSFGIIDNMGCNLVTVGSEKQSNEREGLSLNLEYNKQIEWLKIYFSSDKGEQFAKVKVSDYLN